MKRIPVLPLLGAVGSMMLAVGCAPLELAEFSYGHPEYGARLAGANFEYVKFGVVGEANIEVRLEQMKSTYEIGLVNEALRKIYIQAPKNQPIALVNVVVEISRDTKITTGAMGGMSTSSVDKYLVIRCDIVRFTGPLGEGRMPPPPEAKPEEEKDARLSDDEVMAHARRLEQLRDQGGDAYHAELEQLVHTMIARHTLAARSAAQSAPTL